MTSLGKFLGCKMGIIVPPVIRRLETNTLFTVSIEMANRCYHMTPVMGRKDQQMGQNSPPRITGLGMLASSLQEVGTSRGRRSSLLATRPYQSGLELRCPGRLHAHSLPWCPGVPTRSGHVPAPLSLATPAAAAASAKWGGVPS